MITVQAPVRRARALLRLCEFLARAGRARGFAAQAVAEGGTGAAAIARPLLARLDGLDAALEPGWPHTTLALAPGPHEDHAHPARAHAAPDQLDELIRSLEPELASLERALLKLPGQLAPPEIAEIVSVHLQPAVPVVLVGDESEFDADGFVPLPAWLAAAPLSWPQIAFAALARAAGLGPASITEPIAHHLDRQAASHWGPAYVLAQAERLLRGAPPFTLAERVRRAASDLDSLLDPELLAFVQTALACAETLGDGSIEPRPAEGGPPVRDNRISTLAAFGPSDADAMRFAADRLSAGILASARPAWDPAALRVEQERLSRTADCSPQEVYRVLDGLAETPLLASQILGGGHLAVQRGRLAWLTQSIDGARPARAYADRVLALDALVLKSLETASIHRLMKASSR